MEEREGEFIWLIVGWLIVILGLLIGLVITENGVFRFAIWMGFGIVGGIFITYSMGDLPGLGGY